MKTEDIAQRTDSILTDWVFPIVLATTLVGVALTSKLGFNLWVVSGNGAAAIVYGYVVLVLATMVKRDLPQLHVVGAVVGSFIFGGRAGSFLELVVGDGRSDLIGSILERALLLVSVASWHAYQAWRSTFR